MNLIAVLLNENTETISWLDSGIIKLYKKTSGEWIEIKSLTYSIPINSNIIALRKTLSELVDKLDNCRVFVAKEVSGLLFSILDSYSFNIYELDGIPDLFLDSVLMSVEKLQMDKLLLESKCLEEFSPKKIDNKGNYTVDLVKLMQTSRTVTSKQILIPFLKNEFFETLEVVFDHIPKWFEKDLPGMGYDFKIITDEVGIIVTSIFSKPHSR